MILGFFTLNKINRSGYLNYLREVSRTVIFPSTGIGYVSVLLKESK